MQKLWLLVIVVKLHVATLYGRLYWIVLNTTKETNNIIVVMFDEMNYQIFIKSITWNNSGEWMA